MVLFVIKLPPIISDYCVRYPKETNYVFLDKTAGLSFSEHDQRFRFHPLNKVIDGHDGILHLCVSWGKRFDNIYPLLNKRPETEDGGEFCRRLQTDIGEPLTAVASLV